MAKTGKATLVSRIPLTVASGAGVILDNADMLLAIMKSMTGNELIAAAKQLSKLKAFQIAAVQDAYNEAVKRVEKDKRVTVGRAMKASQFLEGGLGATEISARVAARAIEAVKEKAADSLAKIPGDWLILADKSGSMQQAIQMAKQLAALLAHRVQGKLYLVFFDITPRMVEVTGKKLSEIENLCYGVSANGGTSIGCGLRLLRDLKVSVDGVVIVSDGGQNSTPSFSSEYKALEHEPAVYFLRLNGDSDKLSYELEGAGIVFTPFDLRSGFDEYTLSNVVSVLKPMTYAFLEEVMNTPLVTIDQVFRKEKVHAATAV